MTQGIWTPRCPKCGKFVSDVGASAKAERIEKVAGIYANHGLVDLTDQDWDGDDFDYDEREWNLEEASGTRHEENK